MDPVTIFRSLSPIDAQLVRSRLEAAGFHADVIHEASSLWGEGYTMGSGGVGVQVPSSEAEEATAFLKSSEASE